MELPSALETVLGALLTNHSVTSWKVASENQTPVVVLRLKPVSENQDSVSTQVYRRKPQSQIARDKRRAVEHKQKLELRNVRISNDDSPVNKIGQEIRANQFSMDASDNQNICLHDEKDSVNVHSEVIVCSSNVRDEINTPSQLHECSVESRPPSHVPEARAAGAGETRAVNRFEKTNRFYYGFLNKNRYFEPIYRVRYLV